MNDLNQPPKKVKYINPPNLFKQKVGSGGISKEKLEKSQNAIDTVEVDFKPYAQKFLKQFINANNKAHANTDDFENLKDEIIIPVMQLKANGGMFQYNLLSYVANTALFFLETISQMNDDTYKVLIAHQNTLHAIIKNELKGGGGKQGQALVEELDKACSRYFEKYPESKTSEKTKKKPGNI
ncbi:hypothetical protein N9Z27_02165 [Alphaproteobacteria bacterium]|nr:hypothetical protein [Alphaproteobacteria bacterium]